MLDSPKKFMGSPDGKFVGLVAGTDESCDIFGGSRRSEGPVVCMGTSCRS